MFGRSMLFTAAGFLMICNASGEGVRPPFVVTAKSIMDNVQNCKNNAPQCQVIVRVVPSSDNGVTCLAIIDMATVRVKKNTPVNFVLVRGNMADTQTYQFVGQGIVWSGTAAGSNEFVFSQLTSGNTVAQWTAGSKKSAQDLGYLPLVKRMSDGQLCGAGDPAIANDG